MKTNNSASVDLSSIHITADTQPLQLDIGNLYGKGYICNVTVQIPIHFDGHITNLEAMNIDAIDIVIEMLSSGAVDIHNYYTKDTL